MGRPALGKRPMTATEHQRRWRKRKRLRLVGRVEPKEPKRPLPGPSVPEQELIEELGRELDRVRRELALRDAPPTVVGPDNPSRCSICRRRRDEVPVMLTAELRRFQLFLCNVCIEDLHRLSNKRLAGMRGDTQITNSPAA